MNGFSSELQAFLAEAKALGGWYLRTSTDGRARVRRRRTPWHEECPLTAVANARAGARRFDTAHYDEAADTLGLSMFGCAIASAADGAPGALHEEMLRWCANELVGTFTTVPQDPRWSQWVQGCTITAVTEDDIVAEAPSQAEQELEEACT